MVIKIKGHYPRLTTTALQRVDLSFFMMPQQNIKKKWENSRGCHEKIASIPEMIENSTSVMKIKTYSHIFILSKHQLGIIKNSKNITKFLKICLQKNLNLIFI